MPKHPPRPVQKPRHVLTGFALIMAVIFVSVITILVAVTLTRTTQRITTTSLRVNEPEATRIAESGIEKAVWCLNNPSNHTDCPGSSFSGETNVQLGNGNYTTTVSGDNNSKTIVSTAVVQGSGGQSSRTLQVKLYTTRINPAFRYGLQSGVGGLVMKNNNKITGNVFSTGSVTGSKSLITGDVVLAKGQPTADSVSNPSVSPLNITVLGQTSTTLYLAQSFIPTVTDKIYSVDLKAAKAGTPPSATLAVYSDNNNKPGSSLYSQALSGPSDAAGWENGWTNQLFNQSTTPILSLSTKYWLVIKVSSAGSSANYWKVVRDTTDTSYTNGTSKTSSNGTVWNPAGYDSAFRVYLGGISSTLQVDCTGSLCADNNAIDGNAYAETIANNTNIAQHACYLTVSGTVKAGNGTATCANVSNGPVPCDGTNTVYNTGPYCHYGNPVVNPSPFPLSSAQIAQIESVAVNGGILNGNQTLANGQSFGPKKIIGDLTITASASTPAILTGVLWVQGNIYINGSLKLSNTYSGDSGIIVADNPSDMANSGRIVSNTSGDLLSNSNASTYIMALSTNTSISDSLPAVDIANNLTASVIYAANGEVNLQNGLNIKEITAQRMVMQNNSDITYDSGLANVIFSSGPGASWVYQKGTYQVIRN
ncbi:MAG: hypothetical protein HY092_00495 [Candidatus Kerfeldbacteria bacterium]|nr:hypothetical protein [Candidatus Kerfeldbacteria bacterium]